MAEWLECFVDGLENGLYVLDDEGMFPHDFIATLDWDNARAHDRVRTNGRYPWTATLALTDA